jgi:hypothetical protein
LIIEYNPEELVKYAGDIVFLTEGQDTVNVSYIPYVSEKIRENGIKYHLQGYMFDLLLGGSFLSKEFFKVKGSADFLIAMEKKYSLFQVSELEQLLTEKLHGYISSARREFVKLVDEAKGDNFPNKADYFAINTRVRRYTLMGSVLFREYIEVLLPKIDNSVLEIIRRIPPEVRCNYHIYRKFLLALDYELAKIPYQKTLIPPIIPPKLWRLSFTIQFFLRIIKKASRGKIELKQTYFDFNEILRTSPNWRDLVEETLTNEDSLIYKLGYLYRNYVIRLVIENERSVKDNAEKLAFLISLEILLRIYFLNEDSMVTERILKNSIINISKS